MRLKKIKYNLVFLIVVLVYFSSIGQSTIVLPSDEYKEFLKMEEEYEQLKKDYLQLKADTANFVKAWRKNEALTNRRVERLVKEQELVRKKLTKEYERSKEELIEEYEKKMANLKVGFDKERIRLQMAQEESNIETQRERDSLIAFSMKNERLLDENIQLRERIRRYNKESYNLKEELIKHRDYAEFVSIVVKDATREIRSITSSNGFSSPSQDLEATLDKLEELTKIQKGTETSYDQSEQVQFTSKVLLDARKVLENDYDPVALDKVLQALNDLSELSSSKDSISAEVKKYQELLRNYCNVHNKSFQLVKATNSYADYNLRKKHINGYKKKYNITSETYTFLHIKLQEKLNNINDMSFNPFKAVSCN